MPRSAKLRNKGGYWASDAGGKTRYFGKVDETSYAEALRRFREFLAVPPLALVDEATKPIAVAELIELFLPWVRTHRGEKSFEERSRHLARFGKLFGKVVARDVKGRHLERFIEALRERGCTPDYIHKHCVSVRAMFNRGGKMDWIPPIRPFENVEPVRLMPRSLGEAELPTPEEVRKVLLEADRYADPNMGDLLRLYHATGARTKELLRVRARHFSRLNRQVVLSEHKRAHSLREAVPRTITLNPLAFEIMGRRCDGLVAGAFVFTRPSDGLPYMPNDLANRLRRIRCRAGVGHHFIPYSFRHLWISEMLMAGVDALLVARMAGTSTIMVEKVYGHFRSQSLHDAQARLDAARAGKGAGDGC